MYNKKKNAAEYLVREFLLSLEGYLADESISKTSLVLFLKEYFSYVKNIESSHEAKAKAKYKSSFIEKSFVHYSNITDDDIWICLKQVCEKKTKSGEIAGRLVSRNLPNCYELNPSRIIKAENIIEPYKPQKENAWKLSIDKLNFEAYRSQNLPIYIKECSGASDIFHESTMLNQLSDKKETTCLLYIDKSIPEDEEKKILISLNKAHCLRMPYE